MRLNVSLVESTQFQMTVKKKKEKVAK